MITAIKQYAIHDNRKILPTGNFIHTGESNGKENLVKLDVKVNYNYICELFLFLPIMYHNKHAYHKRWVRLTLFYFNAIETFPSIHPCNFIHCCVQT